MPVIAYDPAAFKVDHLPIIEAVNSICREYADAGYPLTLRALYYRMVARDLFPNTRRWHRTTTGGWVKAAPDDETGTKNADPNYKWLGGIVTDGRMSGLIDWHHLADQHRGTAAMWHDDQPRDLIAGVARSFGIDLWQDQPRRVEVWVEKDALASITNRVAYRNDVGAFSCKGYVSSTALWAASRRFTSWIGQYQQAVTVLYLGDHDPSGIDMSRDVTDRLTTFVDHDLAVARVRGRYPAAIAADGLPWLEVRRIALNMDQVLDLNRPPNPTKLGDSRSASYIEQYGYESWELDAIDPPEMDAMIEAAVTEIRDDELYDARRAEQEERREILTELADNFDDIESRWPDIRALLDE